MAAPNDVRLATSVDLSAIHELLAGTGLPTDDLGALMIDGLVSDHDGRFAGVVGLEGYAKWAASVTGSQRTNKASGLGRRLVERMELRARQRDTAIGAVDANNC